MNVEGSLRRAIARDGAAHLTLIDPANQSPEAAGEIASDATKAGTNGIMVGGSTSAGGELLDQTTAQIKKSTKLPVILFPAGESCITPHADAIFFMSMLNSRDPYFITRAQRLGAPLVKKFGLEVLPMAYLVVEPGGTVGKVGKAELIPRDTSKVAVEYSLAAKFFGMKFVYLEAGSGADKPVPEQLVRDVRQIGGITLIVGGGIRTPQAARAEVKAGADIIVTGTVVESSKDRVNKLREIISAMKGARDV